MPKQPWHLHAPDRPARERPSAATSVSLLDAAAKNWLRPVADAPVTTAVALEAATHVRDGVDG